jgi:ankyrin repeat protein
MNAVESGNIDAVKLLIYAGADLNAISGPSRVSGPSWKKRCALTSALLYPEILEFLIDSGADIDITLHQKRTPLHYAAESMGRYQGLCTLLKNKADVNALDLYKKTPLHDGIYSNKIALALLEYGADVHAVDHEGWKPLHRAYERRDLELLKVLVSRGEPLNEFTPNGGNALHHACAYIPSPCAFELIKYLIEEQQMNVNLNGHSNAGEGGLTPLMYAIGSQKGLEDNFEILDYLLEKGADFNSQLYFISDGKKYITSNSVLTWAKRTKQPWFVIDWMIQNGAK